MIQAIFILPGRYCNATKVGVCGFRGGVVADALRMSERRRLFSQGPHASQIVLEVLCIRH